MSAQPLAAVTSIKVKLGLLVASSVTVAAVLAAVGDAAGVPLLLVLPVTVALALAVTQLLAVGMTAPLRQMTLATRRMARGDYGTRVGSASRDEIGQLAAAFDHMAGQLATVDQERRDLVATVSHELRTPLAALSARLENLADGLEPDADLALAEAVAQSRRLGALVADLLDLSRLDAEHPTLTQESLPVAEFLAEVVAGVDLPGCDVEYDVRTAPADLVVTADRRRLAQVVTNLVANAARHSPPGGLVGVAATASNHDRWVLEVTDTGPGVPESERELVFERFGTAAGHDGGGTGLGLAIARRVVDLHRGSVRFVDPPAGFPGARVRVELPRHHRSDAAEETPVTQHAPPPTPPPVGPTTRGPGRPPYPAPQPLLQEVFGGFWRDDGVPGRRDLLIAGLLVGLLGGVVLPWRLPGLGLFLVLAGAAATVVLAARPMRPFTSACAVLAAALGSVVLLRDAMWIAALCLLAGAFVMTAGLTGARTVGGFLLSWVAWPLAGLRGLPWLGRTLDAVGRRKRTAALIRTVLLCVLGVGIFGVLFYSADPVFAHWMRVVLPDLSLDRLVYRGFVAAAVAGAVLCAAYLALNPPRLARGGAPARPVATRIEWLAPVVLVDVVFVVFLLAQAAAVFGGHDYIQRATGLTYAEYVHQGFAQLTVATALTLLVVWAAARKAPRGTAADRLWLRVALGVLCALTLVVVASALYRVHVYQEAYGFTRLRLLVDVFEAWLGLVVAAILVAGVRLSGWWVPRFSLLTGAAALLALAAVNPDAWIARHNIETFSGSDRMDWSYVGDLSSDAVPTVVELAEDAPCLPGQPSPDDQDWLSWNLGRARAEAAVAAAGLEDVPSCTTGD